MLTVSLMRVGSDSNHDDKVKAVIFHQNRMHTWHSSAAYASIAKIRGKYLHRTHTMYVKVLTDAFDTLFPLRASITPILRSTNFTSRSHKIFPELTLCVMTMSTAAGVSFASLELQI